MYLFFFTFILSTRNLCSTIFVRDFSSKRGLDGKRKLAKQKKKKTFFFEFLCFGLFSVLFIVYFSFKYFGLIHVCEGQKEKDKHKLLQPLNHSHLLSSHLSVTLFRLDLGKFIENVEWNIEYHCQPQNNYNKCWLDLFVVAFFGRGWVLTCD